MRAAVMAGRARPPVTRELRPAQPGRLDLASSVSATIRLDDLAATFRDLRLGRVTRSVIAYD
jgi:Zn-dependent alcohol dehydrogenase